MITQTASYALQILGYLVERQGELVRSDEIAKKAGIPANYLSKILNRLRKSGVVDSRKGWGGGFMLRPDALKRPIGEIVAIFDGIDGSRAYACAFGLPRCDEENPCPLHPYWGRIRSTYLEMLQNTPIGGLSVVRR